MECAAVRESHAHGRAADLKSEASALSRNDAGTVNCSSGLLLSGGENMAGPLADTAGDSRGSDAASGEEMLGRSLRSAGLAAACSSAAEP